VTAKSDKAAGWATVEVSVPYAPLNCDEQTG